MPKISVIVPVYKAEVYLNRCVDSILAQTFTDFELLLIDDGSPDRSGEICDEYARKDSRIRVFHKENGGVSSARNLGLDKMQGEYVAFVDSDDWCEPNYLSDFFCINVDLNYDDIVLQGRKNEVKDVVSGCLLLKDEIYGNVAGCILDNELLTFGAPYCKLYSRKIIAENNIRFPEEYSYGEDTTFFLKVLLVTNRIVTISKCNYHYVDSVGGSLSKKDHEFDHLSKFLDDSMCLVKEIDRQSNANNKLADAYFPSYKNLLLRSIANMYRLGYGYHKKIICFRIIKKILISELDYGFDVVTWVLCNIPSCVLVVIFYMIMKLRK